VCVCVCVCEIMRPHRDSTSNTQETKNLKQSKARPKYVATVLYCTVSLTNLSSYQHCILTYSHFPTEIKQTMSLDTHACEKATLSFKAYGLPKMDIMR
jgi:hypothetical protein